MTYHVYILAGWQGVLYIGVTGDLARRMAQQRSGSVPGFTATHRVHRLVHVEAFERIEQAIEREKQLKGWRRDKNRKLISQMNPGWRDLAASDPRT